MFTRLSLESSDNSGHMNPLVKTTFSNLLNKLSILSSMKTFIFFTVSISATFVLQNSSICALCRDQKHQLISSIVCTSSKLLSHGLSRTGKLCNGVGDPPLITKFAQLLFPTQCGPSFLLDSLPLPVLSDTISCFFLFMFRLSGVTVRIVLFRSDTDSSVSCKFK